MDPCEGRTDRVESRTSGRGLSRKSIPWKAEMDELLARTREELKKAKISGTHSWLGSGPLLDELEKVKAALASAQNWSSISAVVISELETQLKTTNSMIQAKKQQELQATKRINQLMEAIERPHGDSQELELQINERRGVRSNLKQLMRVRRQTLRALSLMLHTTMAEIDAARAAMEDRQLDIICTEKMEDAVQLTLDDQRAARDTNSMRWHAREEIEALSIEGVAYEVPEAGERAKEAIPGSVFTEARARARARDKRDRVGAVQEMRRTRKGGRRKVVKKKRKPSIFHKIKTFFLRSIQRLFG